MKAKKPTYHYINPYDLFFDVEFPTWPQTEQILLETSISDYLDAAEAALFASLELKYGSYE